MRVKNFNLLYNRNNRNITWRVTFCSQKASKFILLLGFDEIWTGGSWIHSSSNNRNLWFYDWNASFLLITSEFWGVIKSWSIFQMNAMTFAKGEGSDPCGRPLLKYNESKYCLSIYKTSIFLEFVSYTASLRLV